MVNIKVFTHFSKYIELKDVVYSGFESQALVSEKKNYPII